ncbi:hypothetical protein CDAR_312681 [Caerostris darwini]|uniref:Uncharacterized protein n=1 Tax=Caerostris darwini TaxID=1538125 RepID=A0AAV4MH63_9ARAC|nr:hypothetical protein CDAR_312681 [Caerostris darwini]
MTFSARNTQTPYLGLALHGLIIRRHNRIVNLLASKAGEISCRVRKEFRCRLESDVTRVPDLFLHDGGGHAIVVDVAISYATGRLRESLGRRSKEVRRSS